LYFGTVSSRLTIKRDGHVLTNCQSIILIGYGPRALNYVVIVRISIYASFKVKSLFKVKMAGAGESRILAIEKLTGM
jgi:hypothetical protein